MNPVKIKAIAGILVIFLLGVILGGLVTGMFIRHKFRQFESGQSSVFNTFFLRKLTRDLKLTESQKPAVEKVLENTEFDVRNMLQNSRREFIAIMQRRNEQLKPILTPEQQQQLDAIQQHIQQRWFSEPSKHP